jgi:hypothetical protein
MPVPLIQSAPKRERAALIDALDPWPRLSLIGIVLFDARAGAILPLFLRSYRIDPASASAPAVATLVYVSGLIIYFSVAGLFILRGVSGG